MVTQFENDKTSIPCPDMVQEMTVRICRRQRIELGENLRAFVVGNICKEIFLHELTVGFFEEMNTGLIDKTECAVRFNPADEYRTVLYDRFVEPSPFYLFVIRILLRNPDPDKIDHLRDIVCHIGAFLEEIVGPVLRASFAICDRLFSVAIMKIDWQPRARISLSRESPSISGIAYSEMITS